MGNYPSQSDGEEKEKKTGVVLSKSDTGEIRITEGFIEQLDEQSRYEATGQWIPHHAQSDKSMYEMVKAAKEKGREEMRAEMKEEMSSLSDQLAKEKKSNSDLKNTSFPIINKYADTVSSKLAPITYKKEKICSDQWNQVVDCYKENPNRSLYCSHVANFYINCVKSQRQNLSRPPENIEL